MATAITSEQRIDPNTVRERVADATRRVEHLAHDARLLSSRATEAVEDAMHAARRTVTRGVHEMEDLRDRTAIRIRQAPFASVAATFAAGVVLGAAAMWLGSRCSRR